MATAEVPLGETRRRPGGQRLLDFGRLFAADLTANWFLWLGLAALAIPTIASIATVSWSTEQGAHGPIVFATGLWLISLNYAELKKVAAPGSPIVATLIIVPSLLMYALARITNILELEGLALYATLVAIFYLYQGTRALRLMWFPMFYMLFLFPPPDSLVAAVTQPLKLWISAAVVDVLDFAGYPIAQEGVTIQVAQYSILVAAACAGLNSLISLSALGIFYVYIRHNANWRYSLIMMAATVPVAILANFVRVMILVLLTYHVSERTAQGFMHDFAGLTMFVAAMLGVFALDALLSPLERRLRTERAA